jgi:hypothetical protein
MWPFLKNVQKLFFVTFALGGGGQGHQILSSEDLICIYSADRYM